MCPISMSPSILYPLIDKDISSSIMTVLFQIYSLKRNLQLGVPKLKCGLATELLYGFVLVLDSCTMSIPYTSHFLSPYFKECCEDRITGF